MYQGVVVAVAVVAVAVAAVVHQVEKGDECTVKQEPREFLPEAEAPAQTSAAARPVTVNEYEKCVGPNVGPINPPLPPPKIHSACLVGPGAQPRGPGAAASQSVTVTAEPSRA